MGDRRISFTEATNIPPSIWKRKCISLLAQGRGIAMPNVTKESQTLLRAD